MRSLHPFFEPPRPPSALSVLGMLLGTIVAGLAVVSLSVAVWAGAVFVVWNHAIAPSAGYRPLSGLVCVALGFVLSVLLSPSVVRVVRS